MPELATGILRLAGRGDGTLRDPQRPGERIAVSSQLIREHALVAGATITGPLRRGRQGTELSAVESVCGLTPAAFRQRTPFSQLVAIDPSQRFHLGATGDRGLRALELVAPIGKGTRGLIVAPPKAGKTMLLEQIARGIRVAEPASRIVVLLIDERPEEMTYFRRAVSAEVFASSSDQSPQQHMDLCELMLAHARTELECRHDVVVLLDSLTRLARAFNLGGTARGGGRTLSGGLDATAMEIPRRFFGLARNVEGGGSVTILASILVDTGSRLDQVIYEELKATGNSEIVLDRALAQERIFPAIDLSASGTRKEELLYSPQDAQRLAVLRRALADRRPREALQSLYNLLDKYPTNEELLASIPVEPRG